MSLLKDLLSLKQPVEQVAEDRAEDSGFYTDYDDVDNLLTKAHAIATTKKWKDHFKAKSGELDHTAVELNRRAVDRLETAIADFGRLYSYLAEFKQGR